MEYTLEGAPEWLQRPGLVQARVVRGAGAVQAPEGRTALVAPGGRVTARELLEPERPGAREVSGCL